MYVLGVVYKMYTKLFTRAGDGQSGGGDLKLKWLFVYL